MYSKTKIILGKTLSFKQNPMVDGLEGSYSFLDTGAVFIKNGVIEKVIDTQGLNLPADAEIIDRKENLILAGFVDAHLHFPQTAIINSWGRRLIDWLNEYTFPEEGKFHDIEYALEIASRYFDICLSHGVTTSVSYGTIHPESVDAFFTEAKARGLRALTGKTCMDRNAPSYLRDSAQASYDQSKTLIEKWHGVNRLGYVITPRFSPTSTPEQLNALGSLWKEYPDCLMQTHIGE